VHRRNTEDRPTTGVRGVIFTDSVSTMMAASKRTTQKSEDQKDYVAHG
jgi:hypothetical protein